MSPFRSCLLFILVTTAVATLDSSNRIIGRPFVACRPDGVSLVVETEAVFEGQLHVKNARRNPLCVKEYSLEQNFTNLELKIDAEQLLLCGFKMWPKPNSKKMLLSGQFVISFHKSLVTPADRAFSAHCEFDDFQKEQDIGLENTIQSHEQLFGSFDAPEVSMSIMSEISEVPEVPKKVYKVGDPIIFQWKLEKPSEIFGIELEKCSAETSDGRGMPILEKGCSLDEELISDAQISPHNSRIFANSLAFKFPEEHVVWIRCSLRTCVRRSEHLEIINGDENDLCLTESSCGIFGQRGRRHLERNNSTRSNLIFVNGRFQIEKHRHFEHLHQNLRQSSATSPVFCMPDVIYYVGVFGVVMCYVITISTTVVWKWG